MSDPDRCGKGEAQPWFLDLIAESVQGVRRVLWLPANGRAELGAGSTEEVERLVGGMPPTEPIEFRRECCHVEPVGLIPRHGKAQQR
ncbi:hypothetical protein [Bradyrhizobium sp. 141]|uniref:hypothetical protein n=1 Tax=Bradyrhizobium sp. 141 TaxID=2782617 RepID=UPI001FFAE483|nr:hypothetical protein [Bradyrhizobium sp. 141]MCK1720855.1 hypothetical protein [Bradyrhizobium sp. 141]